MTGHQRITYACGIHIETQCRCLGHGKETLVGKRACPHCLPARLHNERVDKIEAAVVAALAECLVCPADMLLLARTKIGAALDTMRLPESTRRPEDWCTCNATHECEGHRA